jgi:hypothetical protein
VVANGAEDSHPVSRTAPAVECCLVVDRSGASICYVVDFVHPHREGGSQLPFEIDEVDVDFGSSGWTGQMSSLYAGSHHALIVELGRAPGVDVLPVGGVGGRGIGHIFDHQEHRTVPGEGHINFNIIVPSRHCVLDGLVRPGNSLTRPLGTNRAV